MKAFVIFVLVVLVCVGGYFAFKIKYENAEVSLRNQIDAQQDKNTLVFDNTWKIISQKAQVSDEYKDSFKENYVAIMEERYDNDRGGALMSWVQESNPEFSTELYASLQNSIEAERTNFTREQTRLVDLIREHNDLRMKWPSKVFVGDREEIIAKLVTSKKTKKVFETGNEEDIDLFK